MKAAGPLVLVAAFLVAGCGGSSHDALVRDAISATDDLAVALESSKNAKEATGKLEHIAERMKAIKKQSDALGKLSVEEQRQLKQTYQAEMSKAMARVNAAYGALVQSDPLGVKDLEPVLKTVLQVAN